MTDWKEYDGPSLTEILATLKRDVEVKGWRWVEPLERNGFYIWHGNGDAEGGPCLMDLADLPCGCCGWEVNTIHGNTTTKQPDPITAYEVYLWTNWGSVT